jgi:hypothetical protein
MNMGLRYSFGRAAAAKIAQAGSRLSSASNASALRELLGLGGTLARYIADDGALWFEEPGADRYDKVPMLGRNWREALETGARSDRVLTIHYESLLPHIGDASKYLDLDSVEETMRAMAVIGMDASHYMERRRVRVWNPETGSGHVVSLPAVTTERAAASPSVR